MTYRGSMPHDHDSEFNGQQPQYPQAVNENAAMGVNNGFDAWGNPQFQQPYQNAAFVPVPYPQQHGQPQHYQHPHNAPQQIQPQPQPQNLNYQFQSYDPSFDQRPLQPSPQNSIDAPGYMLQTMQQPVHQPVHQHQYVQQTDWQHMPPPMPIPSPSYQAHQTIPSQVTPPVTPQITPQPQYQYQQQHQHQLSMPQHANSPIASLSPQLPPQFLPNPNNRHAGAGMRMENASRVSASPRLTSQGIARSPSIGSARSPAPTPGLLPHHADTNSLLICLAEEFFAKARTASLSMWDNIDAQSLHEYQKLIATGLGCLEVVLDNTKLPPRLEAKVRFRYASILCAETNNVMEAETALTKGITLCDRNRFDDLKYAMHFLQIKLLFSQQKVKAAMIAVDGRIRDAEVVKHYHWVYAFRFLKTSMYLQSANPSDTHALENLKAVTNLANQRGDRAVFVVASLLEGLSLLKAMKDDAIVRIQACIAQALKYQLDNSIRIPQLDALALMLDLACSLHQKSVQTIMQKLQELQDHMDACISDKSWHHIETELLLPIKKSNTLVISRDTAAILRPGSDDDPCDYLAMSFWSKIEAFTVTYTYSGLALLYRTPRNDKRIFKLWEEAVCQIRKAGPRLRGEPDSLADVITTADSQREWMCYLYILQGLHLATYTRWPEVKTCLANLEGMVKPPLRGIVVLYSKYLSGVYHQGTGDLRTANSIFRNRIFSLDNEDNNRNGSRKVAELDVSLLATFNRIWIMQHPEYRDDRLTLELLEQLRPLCIEHHNMEIRTAYNLVLAAVQTNPPIPMTAVKMHISTALSNAQFLGNVQTLSIALNLMRAKLFQDIVGDQALKSAKAASNQAKKSGNTLWMSVADGMLAQSYDVQGQSLDAQKAWGDATQYARQAVDMMKDESTG
ncbi:cohesin loading factor-domain-containing protein [Hypoxylon rubiginosum]|uniref:Cohesin loading factor-domain-containing protein n=1 Tax=Hypoxylon rubiginosum TaxID=110542 RepID=A0ACB9ZA49_9PEZI|nr:cohesin loading factor-domain-containing protein [Hypoxylon rubiginosum]